MARAPEMRKRRGGAVRPANDNSRGENFQFFVAAWIKMHGHEYELWLDEGVKNGDAEKRT